MERTTHTERGVPEQTDAKTDPTGLIVLSCLPVLVVALTVMAIGGVSVAFLIPALTVAAMVGMLTFVSLREKTRQ
jgi:hypothetical protein